MSEGSSPWAAAAAGTSAGILFAVEFVLSLLLHAAQALSRVALRSLAAEAGARGAPLEELRSPASPIRFAIETARQGCLLGGCALGGLAATWAGLRWPWLLAFAATALWALLVEAGAARALALRNPRGALRGALPVASVFGAVLGPAAGLLRVPFRGPGRPVEAVSDQEEEREEEEEIEAFIEVGEREGILEAGEGKMVRGIVDLGETKVREIMTPRTDIVALPAGSGVEEARSLFLRSGHSRLPAYEGTMDNVVGVLHVRDLLAGWGEGGAPISGLLRPAFFVPETRTVAELLEEMRLKTHFALVVDEYGSLAGLVTLEDLVEEIVGEIREEHEAEEPLARREADGRWVFSGLAHVEELERTFGLDLGERSYDTVGGLVIAAAGRVPAVGETCEVHGLRIEVLEATRRRVHRVRVWRASGERGPARAAL